jgi:hypothetical protein
MNLATEFSSIKILSICTNRSICFLVEHASGLKNGSLKTFRTTFQERKIN